MWFLVNSFAVHPHVVITEESVYSFTRRVRRWCVFSIYGLDCSLFSPVCVEQVFRFVVVWKQWEKRSESRKINFRLFFQLSDGIHPFHHRSRRIRNPTVASVGRNPYLFLFQLAVSITPIKAEVMKSDHYRLVVYLASPYKLPAAPVL